MIEEPRRPRRGPRKDSGDLRELILDSALAEFAEKGYKSSTIRRIAERAGVAPRLIHYYFGSKECLARECMSRTMEESEILDLLLAGALGRERIGERYLCTVLGIVENPKTGPALISLLRAVGEDAGTREMIAGHFMQFVTTMSAAEGADEDLGLRLQLVGSQIIGILLLRNIFGFGPVATADPHELAEIVGPTLDKYLALGRTRTDLLPGAEARG